jgi:hypothetical protein
MNVAAAMIAMSRTPPPTAHQGHTLPVALDQSARLTGVLARQAAGESREKKHLCRQQAL